MIERKHERKDKWGNTHCRAPRPDSRKCVRLKGSAEVIRVPNEEAFQIVDRENRGEYVPKRIWKGARDAKGASPNQP